MDIATKSRAELRAYFVRNAIPTESNFRDFIEGVLNPKDDGLSKAAGRPLSIEAGTTSDQPAIHLYERFAAAQAPNWALSLLPGITSGGKTIGRGFGVSSGVSGSKTRLFIDEATGNLGIGTVDPAGYLLNLAGSLNATGTITASGGISVPAGQALSAGGPFNASAGATVSGGPLNANAGLTVAAGQTLSAGGPLNASAGATISGGPLNANGGLNVPAGQVLNVGGPLNANGGLTVAAGQILSAGGPLNASAGATVSGGALNANGGLNIPAGQVLNVGGPLNANGGLTVAAGQILNAGGPLNASGAISANGGLTVGTAANNQNTLMYGALTVSGAVATGDLTVGTAAANKTLTVNGPLNVTQPVVLSSGVAINGELSLSSTTVLNDNTVYLRNKSDHTHGIGYCGPAKPFQGRSLDGPVLFGYGGGGVGTMAPPFVGVDGVLGCDGTNSFVQLPAINFDWSAGFTIEAAVFYNSFNSWSRIFDFGNGPGSDNILLANSGPSSDLALSAFIGGTDKQVVVKGVLQLGTWMHVCATMDPTGKVVMYINGAVVGGGQGQIPKNLVRNNCYIGRSNWGSDGYFNGKLANVRIWQRPLAAQEVIDAMNQTRPFLTGGSLSSWVTGLAGFWPLNEPSGQTARDLSGKGNTGTLQGKAVFESTQRLALTWDSQNNVTVPNANVLAGRFRPSAQSFQVSGDFNKWYPVVFFDDGWSDGALELSISRTSTNLDSTLRGSTICIIRAHSTAWGNGSFFCKILEHYYQLNQFVGGVANSVRSPQLIVWLRGGGTTYQWRSNHPARLIDCTALDTRSMPFGTNPADIETYTSKTSPDPNLGAISAG